MNSIIRFKLTLTEEVPSIKTYNEKKWAELSDVQLPIDVSLSIIEGVHARLTSILKNMSESDFKRKFFHPRI